MDLRAELLVYHGGRMQIAPGSAEYQGGHVAEVDVLDDYLCFFQLKKIETETLGYDSVERMWYVTPDGTLGTDLREINDDADAERVRAAAKSGVVSIYIEATGNPTVVVDNEDVVPGNEHGYATPDTEAEVSDIRAHEDSDRTSDPEFHEAMDNLGISGLRRRRVRATYQADGGIEVDQLNDAVGNGVQQEEVLINVDEPMEMDFMNMQSVEHQNPTSDADDEDSDFEPPVGNSTPTRTSTVSLTCTPTGSPTPTRLSTPHSSYRGSSQSAHDVHDKLNDDEVNSFAGQVYYDPTCDHSRLVFKEGMRFTGPSQFKDAVVNFTIAMGAEIRWVRSNQKNKEAVCIKEGCKWRVYASWFGTNEAYIVKVVGLPHNCPRARGNRSANAKWIVSKYYNRFKIDPELNTKHLAREINLTHEITVSVRVCSNAKLLAKKMLEGTLVEAYAKLRPYVQ
ncbi:hypothetical protein LINPERHAP2_LOCUS6746 [Linum perenne]